MREAGRAWYVKGLSRRRILQLVPASALAQVEVARDQGAAAALAGKEYWSKPAPVKPTTIRDFFAERIPSRREVEIFLDPSGPNWARFDPELGYTLRDNILKDGVGGSRTITSYQSTGERTMVNYAHRPCRINTYGDSFTQCHQVSDGETWQEVLAAHLGEPIRNFGIGGYGTYQAYRRMVRQEATSGRAEYVILNIWDLDDYLRSIDAWRWLRFQPEWRTEPGAQYMFHANPWVHARLDLKSGEIVEKPNLFSTPESLLQLADLEFVYQHFKHDLVVQLLAAHHGATDVNPEALEEVARALDVKADFSSLQATSETAQVIHTAYALRVGCKVIEKARDFARTQHKQLLILLSYGAETVADACAGRSRFDQGVIDFLRQNKVLFVDTLETHLVDFKAFNLSPTQYVRRYYIGHYSPQGNGFFALAIKDTVVNWLDPKPTAYRRGSETLPIAWTLNYARRRGCRWAVEAGHHLGPLRILR